MIKTSFATKLLVLALLAPLASAECYKELPCDGFWDVSAGDGTQRTFSDCTAPNKPPFPTKTTSTACEPFIPKQGDLTTDPVKSAPSVGPGCGQESEYSVTWVPVGPITTDSHKMDCNGERVPIKYQDWGAVKINGVPAIRIIGRCTANNGTQPWSNCNI